MPKAITKQVSLPHHGWLCFHCGEHFTEAEEREAYLHFGETPEFTPACIMKGERPLLERIRELEGRVRKLHEDMSELDHQASLYPMVMEQLKHYFKGATSLWDAFCKYDSMEGRAIAAEESLRELLKETPPKTSELLTRMMRINFSYFIEINELKRQRSFWYWLRHSSFRTERLPEVK